ncbi:hypothetical protein NRK68_34665 (plasmid) [Streptomyces yangpuensis]|uniref:N-acetyltransferase domain-containing protein n=1 Tax=Streptomyces yangpuensis TaxID=1648182 RepID=A0ABY5Q7J2_9ACTN|nr:hypothetical protein [Streptomyces yangpuensis]UUY52411.1 hypothetical protein NRK68_34665 [Streptomyces yangpuensis]
MERVSWSLGTKANRIELQNFDCCPGCRMDIVRHPNDSRRCLTEWAHSVQKYIHQHAISATNGRARTHDQRLILLRDGDVLVGVGVHYSEELPAESGAVFERRIDAYATALEVHGQKLSNGEYASKALLRAIVSDITTRHSSRDRVFLTALVLPENGASRKCLERYGFREGGQDGPYLVYAATLLNAQNHLGVEPTADIDAFQDPEP